MEAFVHHIGKIPGIHRRHVFLGPLIIFRGHIDLNNIQQPVVVVIGNIGSHSVEGGVANDLCCPVRECPVAIVEEKVVGTCKIV